MKQHIFIFLLLSAFLFNHNLHAVDYVHMSEIMYDTPLNENLSISPSHNGEFIEFYNTGLNPVNLSGWRLIDDTRLNYIFPDAVIPPYSFLILCYQHSTSPEFRLSDLLPRLSSSDILYQSDILLRNTKKYIKLVDKHGLLRDSIYYGDVTSIPKSQRLIAKNGLEIRPKGDYLSIQRIKAEFNPDGSFKANHLHWKTDRLTPFVKNALYIDPETTSPIELGLSMSQNYNITVIPTTETENIELRKGKIYKDENTTIQIKIDYFDGLGRPVQTIQNGITPQGNDLVNIIEYDTRGRESRQWLPIPITDNNGAFVSKSTIENEAEYFTPYSEGAPYSETVYEPSPLNRVTAMRNPGSIWHGHPVKMHHNINTGGEVKRFVVNTSGELSYVGTYSAGDLYKITTEDEDGNTTTEYTNKLGQIVMTRQDTDHDTYYVYDDFGRQRFVLPPLAADSINITNDKTGLLNRYAYQYKYDARHRCVEKRLPGQDWIYMVYDKADRLILTQDGNQRSKAQWTVNKYNKTGKILYTGILIRNSFREEQQRLLDALIVIESYDVNNNYLNTGYSCNYYADEITLLTVYYYDNYEYLNLPAYNAQKALLTYEEKSGYDQAYTVSHPVGDLGGLPAKGLLTGTRTYLLDDSGDYIATAIYYDFYGRPIQTRSTNYLGGFDITYNQYDFSGNLTQSLSEHSTNHEHTNPVTEFYTHTYDHAGRLKETTYELNGNSGTVLVINEYDEIGRLISKHQSNGSNEIKYEYNIRNWLTKINDGDFQQQIYYHQSANDYAEPRYNGNISSMSWTCDEETHVYNYYYDLLNRLVDSYVHTPPVSSGHNSFLLTPHMETFYYDKHGNITNLLRKDGVDNAWYPITQYQTIDNLEMSYNGNQLTTISDCESSRNQYGIKEYYDINKQENDFAYDANGNMITDLDRQIVNIRYNLLNLPEFVQFRDGHQIKNTYTASGQKLKTEYLTAQTPVTVPLGTTLDPAYSDFLKTGTIYTGNKEYETDESENYSLLRVHNTEGYISNIYPKGHAFYYYRRDYLGNNREVWTPGATIITSNSITRPTLIIDEGLVQRTQYYPSGLPWSYQEEDGAGEQPYKAQGKEFIEMHGYNMYDSFARMFDPLSVRTPTPDPHCENYYSISPYAWCGNNFTRYIDPDGMDWYQDEYDFLQWSTDEEVLNTAKKENRYIGLTANGLDANGNFVYGDQYGKTHDSAPLEEVTVTARMPRHIRDVQAGIEMGIYDGHAAFMEHPITQTTINGLAFVATGGIEGLAAILSGVKGIFSLLGKGGAKRGIKNIKDLISAGRKMPRVKGAKQMSVKGNIDDIFNSLAKGNKKINLGNGRYQIKLSDGTTITKYPASSGSPTIQINTGKEIIKILIK